MLEIHQLLVMEMVHELYKGYNHQNMIITELVEMVHRRYTIHLYQRNYMEEAVEEVAQDLKNFLHLDYQEEAPDQIGKWPVQMV